MNNMYDILNKMTLLEGKGKPDFLDLDKDGNKTEPMKKAAKEVDEASYSAKSARAGKDIGKPGKAFAQIAAKAGKAYGSKERGEKVAGAVLAKLRAKEDVAQEGNKFTGNLAKARASGKKMADLDGDGDMEPVREGNLEELDMNLIKAMQKGHKPWNKDPESERNIHKKYGYRGDREEESDDDYDEWGNKKAAKKKAGKADKSTGPKKKGRPAGTGKKLGAKGPTGRSKLLKMKEDETQLVDRGEYDREGDMAKEQLHTIEAAAKELHSILGDDQNLPEWVQSKITKAMDYIDTARDYMLSQEHDQEEMPVAEKAVSKAQQKFMGMVHAAQKGEKPASKEVAKVAKSMGKKDAEDFAATKHKGLPEKVKKEKEVEETTVAGSVAPAPTGGKGKAGMMFGKGVYESQIAESFEKKLGTVLNEGMSINMSVDENGQKTLNVNATDADAEQLAQILKMAGLGGGQPASSGCGCDTDPCSCEQMAEDYANEPEEETQTTDYMTKTIAGGLNKNKVTGMTTIPVVPTQAVTEGDDVESKLMSLYKQYKA